MTKFLYLVGLIVLFNIFSSSCNGNQNKEEQKENAMSLTETDSVTTVQLVSNFMNCMLAGDVSLAANMLYSIDYDDPEGIPYPISDKEKQKLMDMLQIPVLKFEIADLTFYSPDQNEVRCRVYINDRISTNWYFKPVRYLGQWYLCLKDSSEGDPTLSDKSDEIVL